MTAKNNRSKNRSKPKNRARPKYEEDYLEEGFATRDLFSFELREQIFTLRPLTMEDRDDLGARFKEDDFGTIDFFSELISEQGIDSFLDMANDRANPVKPTTIKMIVKDIVESLGGGSDPK